MKYYKQLNSNDEVVLYGATAKGDLPEIVTEISESEYNAGLNALVKADADRMAALEAAKKAETEKQQAEYEAERKKRQEQLDSYVEQVKSKSITLGDVPEEYRGDVDLIINPPVVPPTNEELNARLEASESAIDFLMTAIAGSTE